MGVPDNLSSTAKYALSAPKLKKLSLEQVKQIDEALASIGEYGEIHLILQRGELRYINKVESLKAWKNYDHPDG